MSVHSVVAAVTEDIVSRSKETRRRYLDRIEEAAARQPRRKALGCANLAHGFAACNAHDKDALRNGTGPNLGIVTAYNDMLSAHQPFERYPEIIRAAARQAGGTAQVASGVPAMCDGVTQGETGMELSLFSRDVIALSTAVALSHQMFDAAVYLGVCDKIVPGLIVGALAFGHLPAVFVPAGPMTSGLANDEKAKTRQLYAEGKVGREALLEAEAKSYHGPGTCTFYGTANSNQMLMEVMGLHLPGTTFVNPGTALRDEITRAAAKQALSITALGNDYTPIGRIYDESGGQRRRRPARHRRLDQPHPASRRHGGGGGHRAHLGRSRRIVEGRAADDPHLSERQGGCKPLQRRRRHGLSHPRAAVRRSPARGCDDDHGYGSKAYLVEPQLAEGGGLDWREAASISGDETVLRGCGNPFHGTGGLNVLDGNLGRAVIKSSSIPADRHVVEAPARVFHSQEELQAAFKAGELKHDMVAVVRFQGPKANGMPELHRLTPALGVLQERGLRVALVTDGRMSGASGKVPAAIHVTPEAASGGPIARIRDGDMIRVDADKGRLEVLVNEAQFAARTPAQADLAPNWAGTGRELFSAFRAVAGRADQGASIFELA